MLTYYLSPYRKENYAMLETMELNSIKVNISNTVVALVWSLNQKDSSKSVNILLLVYFCFINGVFLLWWSNLYLVFFKGKLTSVNQKFKDIITKKFSKSKLSSKTSLHKEDEPLNKVANIYDPVEKDDKILKLKLLNNLLLEHIAYVELKLNDYFINPEGSVQSLPSEGRGIRDDNIVKQNVPSEGIKNNREEFIFTDSVHRATPDSLINNNNKFLSKIPEKISSIPKTTKNNNHFTSVLPEKPELVSKSLEGSSKKNCFILFIYKITGNYELLSRSLAIKPEESKHNI